MAKVLKKKFRKKKPAERKLTKIIKKEKIGRWCDAYKGRLPYPIECTKNKRDPVLCIFKDGKKIVLSDKSICLECVRQVTYKSWRNGDWDKIKEAIADKEDLRDHPPPGREE